MSCTSPVPLYRGRDGLTTSRSLAYIDLPPGHGYCNHCMGCRIRRQRNWVALMVAEASVHRYNHFVTLTYDDAHLPDNFSLRPKDLTDFWKRLRRALPKGQKFKYYACGEYGDGRDRPHYHACIFGLNVPDLVPRGPYFSSDLIERKWQNGSVVLAEFSPATASYTASYVLKKFRTSENADLVEINDDFEVLLRVPEFQRFSKELGLSYAKLYMDELLQSGTMIQDGRELGLSQSMMDRLAQIAPLRAEVLARKRLERAQKAAREDHLSPSDREEFYRRTAGARKGFL